MSGEKKITKGSKYSLMALVIFQISKGLKFVTNLKVIEYVACHSPLEEKTDAMVFTQKEGP